jgi:hypothetical protein
MFGWRLNLNCGCKNSVKGRGLESKYDNPKLLLTNMVGVILEVGDVVGFVDGALEGVFKKCACK